ncbi:MAG: TonB-dependent receptor [Deltaproteobacteria bacterium]|nr:TonB-dependent receptor [Deltaproteobacteria bacterium]
MRAARNYVIPVAVLTALWGARAPVHAQPAADLSDEDMAQIAEGEAIEIFDERPDKPFDRDTEVRLTGEQLAARGATDLASALALLPDVTVRDAGRGGFNVDIRGARKGAVAVLIDGVLVSDPYYGTFDVSTIPVTDIVQIRVSTTPQSPIDGPGGPGGVIEVLTRDAVGDQLVIARVIADSLPTFGITATARTALAKHVALRISSSGTAGARDLELPGAGSVGEGRRAATGAGRLEYRKGNRRIAIDGFIDDRRYLSPPSDEVVSNFLLIDRETSARASAKADDRLGTLQLQGQYWVHYLHRRSRQFADPALTDQLSKENLFSIRSGGMLLATRPVGKDYRWATSTVIDHEKALVFDQANRYVRGETTLIELAASGQYERKRIRLDAAAGFATAFGVGADPWPEGKLTAKYRPRQTLEITATTGYKGRVPSLRERFDAESGNPSLGPEKALHAEVRAVEERDRFRLEAAPFYRRTIGTIRTSTDPMDEGKLVNLGTLDIYGVDLQGRGLVHTRLEIGGSYNYVKATSRETGDDPLDRLPAHRADAWARFLANDAYSALVRVRYLGESIDRGVTVEGHALLEATLTAQLTKEYLAVLRVEDALDQQPETRAGYHTAGRVISVVLQGSWQ